MPARLLELLPRLLVYLIGFIIIGGAWGSHQRMVGQITRGDGPLAWLNLLSLLFVTLIPASASLLGRFPTSFLAIVTFAANVVLVQLSAYLMWGHTERRAMINTKLDHRVISAVGRRLALSAGVFALSVPIALISTTIAYVLWISWFILMFATDWLSWQDAYKTVRETFALEGATRAHIRLGHAGGRLRLSPIAAEGVLAEGMFGGGLDANVSRDGSMVGLNLRPGRKPGFMSARYPWAWSPVNSYDWELGLSKKAAIDLDVETSGGQADLDMADLHVVALSLKTSATTTSMRLPRLAGHVDVVIKAAASSMVVHVPDAVAARIRVRKSMSSVELDPARFQATGTDDEYRSPDYDRAPNRLDIRVSLGLDSIRFD